MTAINKFSSYCLKDLVKERRELNISVLEVVFHFNRTLMIICRKKKKAREKLARWSRYILFLLSSGPQKWRDKTIKPLHWHYFFQIRLNFLDASKKLPHTTGTARANECKAQNNQLYIKHKYFFLAFSSL